MLTLWRSYGDTDISILRNISKNVKQSKFYTVMADEVTDVSNHEQLVICIRWIDHNFEQHEDMIGFYQVEDIKSETSFKSIKNALNRMDIPLDFRRQYYDKSSNIVEARTGVVTRIKETLLWSRFTISCHWYRQSNKINRDTLDAASELTKLINILRKGKELSTDWGKKRHQETLVTEHYARLVGLSERYRYKAS